MCKKNVQICIRLVFALNISLHADIFYKGHIPSDMTSEHTPNNPAHNPQIIHHWIVFGLYQSLVLVLLVSWVLHHFSSYIVQLINSFMCCVFYLLAQLFCFPLLQTNTINICVGCQTFLVAQILTYLFFFFVYVRLFSLPTSHSEGEVMFPSRLFWDNRLHYGFFKYLQSRKPYRKKEALILPGEISH